MTVIRGGADKITGPAMDRRSAAPEMMTMPRIRGIDLWRGLSAALVLVAGIACAASPAPLRVMSFNVRVPVEADGPDR